MAGFEYRLEMQTLCITCNRPLPVPADDLVEMALFGVAGGCPKCQRALPKDHPLRNRVDPDAEHHARMRRRLANVAGRYQPDEEA